MLLIFTDVQKAVKLPTLVGSGVTVENVASYLSAHGMIIGSHLKMHGQWYNDLDAAQVKQFMSKVIRHRNSLEEKDTVPRQVVDELIAQTAMMDDNDEEMYLEDSDYESSEEKLDNYSEFAAENRNSLNVKPLTVQGE